MNRISVSHIFVIIPNGFEVILNFFSFIFTELMQILKAPFLVAYNLQQLADR